jgi:glycosyltransferase involved in cell wall biosynthesis
MVKYDKWLNKLSTNIIAISKNVRDVLVEKENVPSKKVSVINHGFDIARFASPDQSAVKVLNKKYNPNNRGPVIGVISRYIHLKGIQFIIPAFQELLNSYPDALLMLANAGGDYAKEIKMQLADLPEGSYAEIQFEKDLFSLYSCFDIITHVPVDESVEAYGQIYVEALAAGIPAVFTLSGIAREFIRDGDNALVVPFCNAEAILQAYQRILSDDSLKNQLIMNGQRDVQRLFPVQRMINELAVLYRTKC